MSKRTETVAERNSRLWMEDRARKAREAMAEIRTYHSDRLGAVTIPEDECETCEGGEECTC